MDSIYMAKSNDAFVLSIEHLREIEEVLKPVCSAIIFQAICIDNTTRIFQDLDELASYNNLRSSRIVSFGIEARTSKSEIYTRVSLDWEFDENEAKSSLHIRITSDDDTTKRIRSRLEEIIEQTKPWYWRIAKFDTIHLIDIAVIICVVASIFNIAVDFFGDSKIVEPITISDLGNLGVMKTLSLGVWIIVFIIFGLKVIGMIAKLVIIKPKRYYFPMGTFLIGDEKIRHDQKENTRNQLKVSVPIAIIVLALGWFIA